MNSNVAFKITTHFNADLPFPQLVADLFTAHTAPDVLPRALELALYLESLVPDDTKIHAKEGYAVHPTMSSSAVPLGGGSALKTDLGFMGLQITPQDLNEGPEELPYGIFDSLKSAPESRVKAFSDAIVNRYHDMGGFWLRLIGCETIYVNLKHFPEQEPPGAAIGRVRVRSPYNIGRELEIFGKMLQAYMDPRDRLKIDEYPLYSLPGSRGPVLDG